MNDRGIVKTDRREFVRTNRDRKPRLQWELERTEGTSSLQDQTHKSVRLPAVSSFDR